MAEPPSAGSPEPQAKLPASGLLAACGTPVAGQQRRSAAGAAVIDFLALSRSATAEVRQVWNGGVARPRAALPRPIPAEAAAASPVPVAAGVGEAVPAAAPPCTGFVGISDGNNQAAGRHGGRARTKGE